MVYFFEKKVFKSQGLQDIYPIVSFAVGLCVLLSQVSFSNPDPFSLEKNLFLIGFNLISFSVMISPRSSWDFLSSNSYGSKFLLAQIFFWIGDSIVKHNLMGFLFSLVPFFVSLHMIDRNKELSRRSKDRKVIFLSMIYFLGVTIAKLKTDIFESDNQYFSFVAFYFWMVVTVSYLHSHLLRSNKDALKKLFSKSEGQFDDPSNHKEDRFFFHDVMGVTHGMGLFIGQKINNRSGITFEEAISLQNEIKTMQSMIIDHYGIKHRNNPESYDVVEFDMAKTSLFNLIKNYFPDDEFQCHFYFEGLISDNSNLSQKSLCKVHLPSFYRIMNNLIKNISESGAKNVDFTFNYDLEGLKINIVNSLYREKSRNYELAGQLSDMILNSENNVQDEVRGIGLESVSSICASLGGRYEFRIDDGHWISEVFLPNPHTYFQSVKKAS